MWKSVRVTKEIGVSFNNDNHKGNFLLLGNFNGVFGERVFGDDGFPSQELIYKNLLYIREVLINKHHFITISDDECIDYFKNKVMKQFLYKDDVIKKIYRKYWKCISFDEEFNKYLQSQQIKETDVGKKVFDSIWNRLKKENMKFDTIVQNPPYDGTLHLDFFEKGLDVLTDNGKMVIIEPATWLINIRDNKFGKKVQKYKQIQNIKSRIEGHVESVVIENLNKEFNINNFVPFSVTTIDFSKTFESIDFVCCGIHKTVNSIYDCNLIGDYDTIQSIINKVGKYGDFMKDHITKKDMGEGVWYAKYADIVGGVGGALCAATTDRLGGDYESDSIWKEVKFGKYCTSYTSVGYHFYKNEISNTPLCSYDRGKHLTDKIADNVYGTREELENWKYFIFNNKLPLFLNIVMTIDQNNNSKPYLPWLVDRKYTDEEINEMFGFTEEEIKLIDYTIKKYEKNSIWFKRYMCGKESITDEDVMSDIERIRNEVENEHKTQSNVERR